MSASSPFYCRTCVRHLPLSSAWRQAHWPVEFRTTCPECGQGYRILVRLQPSFSAVPETSRYDWTRALAHDLYLSFSSAAKKEADLTRWNPADWETIPHEEQRLWLGVYRHYLRRHAA